MAGKLTLLSRKVALLQDSTHDDDTKEALKLIRDLFADLIEHAERVHKAAGAAQRQKLRK
jgi:hypothetical protein